MKLFILGIVLCSTIAGCDSRDSQASSNSGVIQAKPVVALLSNGLTIEQDNVRRRLEHDSKPGVIKHLYIISPFTGDVLIYSTVKGKVTSGGKRLSPYNVSGYYNSAGNFWQGNSVKIGDKEYRTDEVLQDDGTYGGSSEYIYWWDANDVYHQQLVGGGIIHISDQPLHISHALIEIGK